MSPEILYQTLKKNGFGPFVGVPCSILTPFLQALEKDKAAVIATSEGEAVGIAGGLYLAGRMPVVFMQNSGLCNALNPLTSLNLVYKIPLLLMITLRGQPGLPDAPEHKIMGEKTEAMLKLLGIEYRYLTAQPGQLERDLASLAERIKKELKPVALLLKRGVLKKGPSSRKDIPDVKYELTRRTAVDEISGALDENCFVITATGKISREYYFNKARTKNNFYMVGSMGCASAIGLGVAMSITGRRRVVVIDGDGAVLMKMGNLATIGNISPDNLIHIVLDNQCHESTGGQRTASSSAVLEKIARHCGYLNIYRAVRAGEIGQALKKALTCRGPCFILVKIAPLAEKEDRLGRVQDDPEQIKESFMKLVWS